MPTEGPTAVSRQASAASPPPGSSRQSTVDNGGQSSEPEVKQKSTRGAGRRPSGISRMASPDMMDVGSERQSEQGSSYHGSMTKLRRGSKIAASLSMVMSTRQSSREEMASIGDRNIPAMWEQDYLQDALTGKPRRSSIGLDDYYDSDEDIVVEGKEPPYKHIERAYKSTDKFHRMTGWRDDYMARAPSSYFENSMDEQAIIGPLMHYTSLFKEFTPSLEDTPPMICPKNECGVRKFVCCTITPTKPIESAVTEVEIAEFVRSYLSYESLPFPSRIPPYLPSPATVMQWQIADSYDYANVLASFLIGAGYDAYVVSGTAPQVITRLETHDKENPYIDPLNLHVKDLTEKERIIAPVSDVADQEGASQYISAGLEKHLSHKSRFDPARDELDTRMPSASSSDQQLTAPAKPAIRKQNSQVSMRKKRIVESEKKTLVHAWVMVVPRSQSHIPVTAFIEPTTGDVHMLNKSPYFSIHSLWNHRNYYICLQDQSAADTSELSYDLEDPRQWLPLIATEQSNFIMQSCSIEHLQKRLKEPGKGDLMSLNISVASGERRSSISTNKSAPDGNFMAGLRRLSTTAEEQKSSTLESELEEVNGMVVLFRECLKKITDENELFWSNKIEVPYHSRASQFRSAKVCDFAKSRIEFYPHFKRDDGLVCRITYHTDRPHRITDALERDKVNSVVEKYFRRTDMLERRIVNLGSEPKMTEKFTFGRKDRLMTHSFVRGTSRDLKFYPGAHIHTGLSRRFIRFNQYVCEEFEDWRTDRLTRRFIKIRSLSIADLAVSVSLREKYGPLPPSKNPAARLRLQEALRRLRWASSFVRRGTSVEAYNDANSDSSSIVNITEYFDRDPDKSKHTGMDVCSIMYDIVLGNVTVGLFPLPGSIVTRKLTYNANGVVEAMLDDKGTEVLLSKISKTSMSEGVEEPVFKDVNAGETACGDEDKVAPLGFSDMQLQVLFKKLSERKLTMLEETKSIQDVCTAVNKTRAVEEAERVKIIRPRNDFDIEDLNEADTRRRKNRVLDMWNQNQYRKFGLQMEYGYRWLHKVEERRRRGRLRKATEMHPTRGRKNQMSDRETKGAAGRQKSHQRDGNRRGGHVSPEPRQKKHPAPPHNVAAGRGTGRPHRTKVATLRGDRAGAGASPSPHGSPKSKMTVRTLNLGDSSPSKKKSPLKMPPI